MIRSTINRAMINCRKKVRVHFVDEKNLARFYLTEEMLDQKLSILTEDLNFEIMNLSEFNLWLKEVDTLKSTTSDIKLVWAKKGKEHLKLEDFKILKVLGRGGFGKVLLCQNGKSLFAMKVLLKKQLVANDQVEHTKAEKDVLANVNHQFLVSLECAYMDPHKIYFIMELMKGGDIYSHLEQNKRFGEEEVKFFIACIVLALGHLHANHYIYRDLKLENILMDE